ncbi:hypothetical protein [Pseudodesulfovibrio sediminis]|uniref:STAS/SEC14 domain-containing protein n=1 Tax=Pseudodesulfovibrio sediminis TaxID=2810563 RepID=A0ABM7PA92_9BACT|nr:hypothetical protein [Pseudodesulfovibrio sediminis]BCS89999.1 hypothetical protein PSDVSF_32410 [Pseudodesulfovibrio sediminis]
MVYSREYELVDDWIRITTTGRIDSGDEFIDKVLVGADKVLELDVRLVLLDELQLELALDNLDIKLGVGSLDHSEVHTLGLRIACLFPPANRALYTMYETVYRNRSINFRLFDDEQAAIAWLKE